MLGYFRVELGGRFTYLEKSSARPDLLCTPLFVQGWLFVEGNIVFLS